MVLAMGSADTQRKLRQVCCPVVEGDHHDRWCAPKVIRPRRGAPIVVQVP